MLVRVDVKPLSVNEAWLGRKTKSKSYRIYEKLVAEALPDKIDIPKKGMLKLKLNVYFSNSRADLDNVLKPFIDILQKKYGFNDCRVYQLDIEKFICKKGEERLEFSLEKLDE